MRKILMAATVAILLAVSCDEQSPDRFRAPEFGQVEVLLDGYKATVTCEVSGATENLTCGFLLHESDSALPQEIVVSPKGGKLKADVNGLIPATTYSIQAFATNSINHVFSAEARFTTAEEDEKYFVNLPDPIFKQLILKDFDRNNDGYLSLEEAEAITTLEFCSDEVGSIEGVEAFSNLERFAYHGSGIEEDRRTGKVTKIDLSDNKNLRSITVDGTNLTELLLPEKNSYIEEIRCYFNKLEELDVTGCPKLKLLYCWNNHLTSLDLSNNRFLTDLKCAQNDFSNGLDVSACPELRYFACNDSWLPTIDISNNTKLIEFICQRNMLSNIDLSMNKDLVILRCDQNYINSIDVSNNTELKIFDCGSNQISRLDVSHLSKLEEFSPGDNPIAEPFDLSCFPNLAIYFGNNLPIKKMPDFSHNPKLTSIHFCGEGGAYYMDKDFFRDWPDVKAFNIGGYPGDTIDLSLNTKMEDIWIGGMPNVKILDLSASPVLKFIVLSGDEKLETVYVHKEVDISKLTVETDDKVHAVIEHKQ